jgi:hypothetical protein
MTFRLTKHAREELRRRRIPEKLLNETLHAPQQVVAGKKGRSVYQSKLDFGRNKMFLLRAIVADQADPAVVITVYKTSRIEKYWRKP